VAVLGGGLAGMAAALRLGEAGFAVELFEKRPVLGGRASSFVPPGETEPIDNCQHVLLGCCTNLLDFFRRGGALDKFRFYSRFDFESGGAVSSFSASALPAPLHLLPSLVRFHSLGRHDRGAVARAMLAIARTRKPYPDEPFAEWLDRQRQSAAAREHFWKVILVSALNEELDRLSTRAAFHVFMDGFIRNRRGYRMGVPTVPLSELYSTRLLGGACSLRLGTAVRCLEVNAGRIERILLQNGEAAPADYFVSAVPPDALVSLLSIDDRRRWADCERWAKLDWSPITGVHLWFDRPVMSHDHLTVSGRTIQWLFNKSAGAANGASTSGGQYVQAVISASRSLVTMRREEILELVVREIAEVLPQSRQAGVRKSVVVKETEATPAFSPGTDDMRPGAETPFSNLFLAGDWTATGWPPTMEGAVRSGYRAAEGVALAAGLPQRFLLPDLPSDLLARLILRS
jgi:zeta-carotene desaturase